LNNMKENK